MAKPRTQQPAKRTPNQLRIIGGQWRGRKLSFPTIDGLRPTPDRVRETLFNWLAAEIPGARCLDLFAGSGALGLEALSRGASHVDLVDSNSLAVQQLQQNLQLLNTHQATAWLDSAEGYLDRLSIAGLSKAEQNSYDLVFLDPPFRMDLAEACIAKLTELQLFSPRSWVYLEMGSDEALPDIPSHWHLHREKTAGQVCYRLFAICLAKQA